MFGTKLDFRLILHELSFLPHFHSENGFVQRECKIHNIETKGKCELEQAPDIRERVFCDTDECNGVVKNSPAPVKTVILMIIMKILSIQEFAWLKI